MTSPLCVATGGWCRRVFHYRPPTPMYRNSPPLCTIVLQIPSLMPLKMRKVQLGGKVRSMTPAQRRELTDRQHRHPSIVRQCQLMGVSRSSLYYRPKETSRQDLSLMREMDRQYLETPFYGSRRMKASLDRQGMPVSRKRVQRLIETDGTAGYLPAASHQPTSGGTLGLSLPAEGSDDHPSEPGMGG